MSGIELEGGPELVRLVRVGNVAVFFFCYPFYVAGP